MIRAAGTTAATVAAAGLGTGTTFASPPDRQVSPGLRTFIDGKMLDQRQIVEWERRRLSVAAARLRKDYAGALVGELDSLLARLEVAVDDISTARSALARARMVIGPDGLRELLTG